MNDNHFIEKVNVRLLRRILIAGNARALPCLGRKRLFELH